MIGHKFWAQCSKLGKMYWVPFVKNLPSIPLSSARKVLLSSRHREGSYQVRVSQPVSEEGQRVLLAPVVSQVPSEMKYAICQGATFCESVSWTLSLSSLQNYFTGFIQNNTRIWGKEKGPIYWASHFINSILFILSAKFWGRYYLSRFRNKKTEVSG